MNTLKFIQTKLLFACLFIGCSTSQRLDTKVVYYVKFDIFKLSGSDTIPASKIGDRQNSEFIEVSYKDKLPILITYHFADRTVVLKQDSIFRFNNRNIYVYTTGNLLGGKAGKQREYSFHNIDNGYKLFIDLSDTILVKRYDNIDIKSGDSYHYMVDVYTKKEQQFNRYSLLQDDTNTGVREDSLYKYWSTELNILKPGVISNIISFPPK